jgi:hypothetical protein
VSIELYLKRCSAAAKLRRQSESMASDDVITAARVVTLSRHPIPFPRGARQPELCLGWRADEGLGIMAQLPQAVLTLPI